MAFPDAPISFLDKNPNELIQAAHINAIQDEIELIETTLLTGGLPSQATSWPVGSVFLAVVPTNPGVLLGVGVWAAFGTGRMLVGHDPAQTEFDVVEEVGGAKTHTLTAAEMPSHTHLQDAHTHTQNAHTHTQDAHAHLTQMDITPYAGGPSAAAHFGNTLDGISHPGYTGIGDFAVATNQAATATNIPVTATNQATGGGAAHNNLPPYIVVYMWKRTA